MEILSSALFATIAAGLSSAIIQLFRHSRAERALVKEMRRDQATDDATRQLLEWARTQLAAESPDPATIAAIAALLTDVSTKLPKNDRKDILGTLAQGSDKSKANYLVKIISEVGSTEAQAS